MQNMHKHSLPVLPPSKSNPLPRMTGSGSIEKASEASEHLVENAVAAVLEGQLPLPQLLKLPHLLVHHVRRLF